MFFVFKEQRGASVAERRKEVENDFTGVMLWLWQKLWILFEMKKVKMNSGKG